MRTVIINHTLIMRTVIINHTLTMRTGYIESESDFLNTFYRTFTDNNFFLDNKLN